MSGGGGGIGATVSRAASGFVQSGPIGAISNVLSGNAADREAEAAQRAAEAQQAAAGNAQAQIMQMQRQYQQSAMDLAKATPQELRAQEQALGAYSKQLAADERMLASIDPGLLEASQKALSIMRGGVSGRGARESYSPFEQARSGERQKLIDSLREQYGQGAESSAIGLKALREFDLQSAVQSAQFGQQFEQQKFSQAAGLAQYFGGLRSGLDLTRNSAQNMNIASAFQNRMLNTQMQTGAQGLSALAGTQAAVINSAGAQFVGDQYRARYDQAMANQFMQGAMQFGTAAITGGMARGGGGGGGGGMAYSSGIDQNADYTSGYSGASLGSGAGNPRAGRGYGL